MGKAPSTCVEVKLILAVCQFRKVVGFACAALFYLVSVGDVAIGIEKRHLYIFTMLTKEYLGLVSIRFIATVESQKHSIVKGPSFHLLVSS